MSACGEDRLDLAAVDAVAVADVAVAPAQLAEAVEEPRAQRLGRGRAARPRRAPASTVDDGRSSSYSTTIARGRPRPSPRPRRRRRRRARRRSAPVDGHDRPVLDRVTRSRGRCRRGRPPVRTQTTPGMRLGRRRVDRARSARAATGAAQDLPVQHPRHDDVADELGLPAQLLVAVPARRSSGRAPRRSPSGADGATLIAPARGPPRGSPGSRCSGRGCRRGSRLISSSLVELALSRAARSP